MNTSGTLRESSPAASPAKAIVAALREEYEELIASLSSQLKEREDFYDRTVRDLNNDIDSLHDDNTEVRATLMTIQGQISAVQADRQRIERECQAKELALVRRQVDHDSNLWCLQRLVSVGIEQSFTNLQEEARRAFEFAFEAASMKVKETSLVQEALANAAKEMQLHEHEQHAESSSSMGTMVVRAEASSTSSDDGHDHPMMARRSEHSGNYQPPQALARVREVTSGSAPQQPGTPVGLEESTVSAIIPDLAETATASSNPLTAGSPKLGQEVRTPMSWTASDAKEEVEAVVGELLAEVRKSRELQEREQEQQTESQDSDLLPLSFAVGVSRDVLLESLNAAISTACTEPAQNGAVDEHRARPLRFVLSCLLEWCADARLRAAVVSTDEVRFDTLLGEWGDLIAAPIEAWCGDVQSNPKNLFAAMPGLVGLLVDGVRALRGCDDEDTSSSDPSGLEAVQWFSPNLVDGLLISPRPAGAKHTGPRKVVVQVPNEGGRNSSERRTSIMSNSSSELQSSPPVSPRNDSLTMHSPPSALKGSHRGAAPEPLVLPPALQDALAGTMTISSSSLPEITKTSPAGSSSTEMQQSNGRSPQSLSLHPPPPRSSTSPGSNSTLTPHWGGNNTPHEHSLDASFSRVNSGKLLDLQSPSAGDLARSSSSKSFHVDDLGATMANLGMTRRGWAEIQERRQREFRQQLDPQARHRSGSLHSQSDDEDHVLSSSSGSPHISNNLSSNASDLNTTIKMRSGQIHSQLGIRNQVARRRAVSVDWSAQMAAVSEILHSRRQQHGDDGEVGYDSD